jgi:hypothetical protein
MFFEKNLQALRQADPFHERLISTLEQTSPPPEGDYRFTQSQAPGAEGQHGLTYRGVALHDPQQPQAEAQALIAQHLRSDPDQIHLVMGLGLGYVLASAYVNSPGFIAVFEPDPALLRLVLENVDLSGYFASGRVRLTMTEADLLAVIRPRLQSGDQVDTLCLPGEARRLWSVVSTLSSRLQVLFDDIALDYRSAEAFHRQWLRQFFANAPHLPEASPLHALAGCFAGKPAIVISRGPSLDAVLPALRTLRDSAVLIAVGGAVRRLWEAGLLPDFALFYDANGLREQRYGIPDEAWSQIAAVIHPCAQPGCFEAPAREKFYFLTHYNKHLADWLRRTLGEDAPLLGGGGTVSIIALRQALLMGCDPIVLAGQDLAFPDNQVYAGGIALQTDEYGQMVLPPSETLYAEPEAMTTVTGQNGEALPALHAFPGFIRQLERIAAENAQSAAPVRLYNASIGGARIEGYPLKPLADFESEWPAWKQGRHALDALPDDTSGEEESPETSWLADLKRGLQTGLMALQADLQEAEALCRELEAELARPGARTDANALQGAMNRFAGLLDREDNALLAFIPAFELRRYRRRFREAVAMRRQGIRPIPDMHAEFVRLLEESRRLFAEIRTTVASTESNPADAPSVP